MPGAKPSRSATLVVLARSYLTSMGVIDDPHAHSMLPAKLGWRGMEAVLRLPGFGVLGRNASFAYLAGRTCLYDDS